MDLRNEDGDIRLCLCRNSLLMKPLLSAKEDSLCRAWYRLLCTEKLRDRRHIYLNICDISCINAEFYSLSIDFYYKILRFEKNSDFTSRQNEFYN